MPIWIKAAPSRGWTIVRVSLGTLMFTLDTSMVSPALPTLQQEVTYPAADAMHTVRASQ